ncbi:MAG: ribonuclease HII [Rothia sp. (in: high G+C Gram-positive bacteria)]|nr:ribonuclease HII [Rothia sp. (in: high G+C Gram-positive bacteria)]
MPVKEPVSADLSVEARMFAAGKTLVAGMDEVGRGPLAGPVTVGVAVIDSSAQLTIEGLIDSKALSEKKRVAMAPQVRQWAVTAVGHASPAVIDALGITTALRLAGQRALAQVAAAGAYPDAVLLDGKHNWLSAPEPDLFSDGDAATSLYQGLVAEAWAGQAGEPGGWFGPVQMEIKGDYRCASIAAASVVAKVERDTLMDELDSRYPGYGWAKNKGYGSPAHRTAIDAKGPTPVHRLSWSLPATGEQIQQAMVEREKEEG